MGAEFSLSFPSVDDITQELKCLGSGSHIYKIDISCAFRHVKIDPLDYYLLGLYWDLSRYVSPVWEQARKQLFQHISDTIRFALRRKGFQCVNYIDGFIGFSTPNVGQKSFDTLHVLLQRLSLTISEKKLVFLSTRAVCLGVMLDSVEGTISIPEEKLRQITQTDTEQQGRKCC